MAADLCGKERGRLTVCVEAATGPGGLHSAPRGYKSGLATKESFLLEEEAAMKKRASLYVFVVLQSGPAGGKNNVGL